MSFTAKQIGLTFELGTGVDGKGPPVQIDVDPGHRVLARITKAGGASMGEAHIRIFGLSPGVMNALTEITPWAQIQRKNAVTIKVGEEGGTLATVYQGQVTQAWIMGQAAPDVYLEIIALAGLYDALTVVPALSYPGPADAVEIMSGLARRMSYAFENSGVPPSMLAHPTFSGSARDQAAACAAAAGFNWVIDKNTLAIWPERGSRKTVVPVISADTGMVGYPSYTGNGIAVSTLFDPAIEFGGVVELKTTIAKLSGRWVVYGISYDLDAEMPGGAWFTSFTAIPEEASGTGARP